MEPLAGSESDVEAWARHLATPWGRVQSSLLRQRLAGWVGPAPLRRVLDVGCGFGETVAALATRVESVTCVDRSEAMLAEAQKRLSGSLLASQFVHRELDSGLSGLGTHDLVIAHNVVDYAADPRWAIRDLAGSVAPGGALSLSFGNAASYALRYVVMTHDLAEGLRLARLADIGLLPGPCGDSTRLRRVTVEHWLQEAGIAVTHRAGVRIVTDLLPNAVKTDQNLDLLEALELELGERPDLMDLAAIVHLFGCRK